tara:strand:+ start:2499 stop:3164 length:666 start_codon:yes stop_codon:yes gene_type:complete
MSNYFSRLPDFEYVSRLPDAKISDYIRVKNLFKKGVLREDIFQDLAFFTKYDIKGNDRPDNVSFDVYGRSDLDWLVLTANNIINVQTEWPMSQADFDRYLLDKYGTYEKMNATHHHETIEIKNTDGVTIVAAGLRVESDFSVNYFDHKLQQVVTANSITTEVTNYQYEEKLENEKRHIFILKPFYLNVVLDDLEEMMIYEKGSTQYQSETLKRADNIRLYG